MGTDISHALVFVLRHKGAVFPPWVFGSIFHLLLHLEYFGISTNSRAGGKWGIMRQRTPTGREGGRREYNVAVPLTGFMRVPYVERLQTKIRPENAVLFSDRHDGLHYRVGLRGDVSSCLQ